MEDCVAARLVGLLGNDLLSVVPVVIDVDISGHLVREFILWSSVNRSKHAYETFASQMVRDLDLPIGCVEYLAGIIEDQVNRFMIIGLSGVPALLTYKINIWLDGEHYVDTILWDATNPLASAVEVAVQTVKDLGLGAFGRKKGLSDEKKGLILADTFVGRFNTDDCGVLSDLSVRERRWVNAIIFQMAQQTQQQALISHKAGLIHAKKNLGTEKNIAREVQRTLETSEASSIKLATSYCDGLEIE